MCMPSVKETDVGLCGVVVFVERLGFVKFVH